MRISYLFILFFAHNIFTSGTMISPFKVMLAGFSLSAGSGIVTELFYPTQKPEKKEAEFVGNIGIAIAMGILNCTIAIYNITKKAPDRLAASDGYIPFCALFGSVFAHEYTAKGTRYIKNFLH